MKRRPCSDRTWLPVFSEKVESEIRSPRHGLSILQYVPTSLRSHRPDNSETSTLDPAPPGTDLHLRPLLPPETKDCTPTTPTSGTIADRSELLSVIESVTLGHKVDLTTVKRPRTMRPCGQISPPTILFTQLLPAV